jgi:hypothetical protein
MEVLGMRACAGIWCVETVREERAVRESGAMVGLFL